MIAFPKDLILAPRGQRRANSHPWWDSPEHGSKGWDHDYHDKILNNDGMSKNQSFSKWIRKCYRLLWGPSGWETENRPWALLGGRSCLDGFGGVGGANNEKCRLINLSSTL